MSQIIFSKAFAVCGFHLKTWRQWYSVPYYHSRTGKLAYRDESMAQKESIFAPVQMAEGKTI